MPFTNREQLIGEVQAVGISAEFGDSEIADRIFCATVQLWQTCLATKTVSFSESCTVLRIVAITRKREPFFAAFCSFALLLSSNSKSLLA
jgi:hypothetical protein